MTATTATPSPERAGRLALGDVALRDAKQRLSKAVASDLVGLADAAAILLGGAVAWTARPATVELPLDWVQIVELGLLSAIVMRLVLQRLGMYTTTRLHDFPAHPGKLLVALAIAFVAVNGLWLTRGPSNVMSLAWLAYWLCLSFAAAMVGRHVARRALTELSEQGAFDTRVAVYGSSAIAQRVEKHLRTAGSGVGFAGLYDDRRDANRRENEGPAVSGGLADLAGAIRRDAVDHVVVALPQSADRRTTEIVARLEQLPVRISVVTHIASDLVDEAPSHRVASLGPVGLIDLKSKPLDGWGSILKAIVDYSVGTIALVMLTPVLIAIAIAIRLDSPGPILFRQRRRGRNEQVFEVLKFRTMRVMEDGPVVRQATKGDPRITRVGAFLRRTSLDELPQVINVLRGEMSLVGPRPHAIAHDDHYGELIKTYASRHQLKPGITGLAQVKGLRGETETVGKMAARLEQDLAYVNNWSIWLDLKILALTGVKAWSSENAY